MGYQPKINPTKEEEINRKLRDFHDHNMTSLSDINKTLFSAIDVIEQRKIPYAVIGGLAVKELGRPRITHDIDIFVRPDDAYPVLVALKENGFDIEKRDPFWLYKAWRDDVLVDIIFRSCGDIYFEEEVQANVRRLPYFGRYINAISPEDFVIIKTAAHQEDNPHHWHDALSVLTQSNLNWEYLYKRSRHCPRRLLSLLIYAQSIDIAIPTEIIQRLYRHIFEHSNHSVAAEGIHYPYREIKENHHLDEAEKKSPVYTKGRIMEAFTKDERIAENDFKLIVTDSHIVIKGEVFTFEQKKAVEEVIEQIAPDMEIKNHVDVRIIMPPSGSEAIS